MTEAFSARIRGGLIFGAWSAALLSLVFSGRTSQFLRPEFAWLLGFGAFVALAFLFAILRNPIQFPVSRMLILLLPLLHMAASDPASMGKDIFTNRFLGVYASVPPAETPRPKKGVATFPEANESASPVPDAVINQGFAGQEDFPVTAEKDLTILQLLRSPQAHAGKTVTLLGLLHRDPKLEESFGPGRNVALYRFVIACCAADALPVAVALEGEIPAHGPDQWAEIKGLFELPEINGTPIPVVRVHSIEMVPPPANPFLY